MHYNIQSNESNLALKRNLIREMREYAFARKKAYQGNDR